MPVINPPVLTINLENIKHNWKVYNEKCLGGAGAVIKANAYSLGAVQIYKSLIEAGCDNFWVATIEEGVELKKVNNEPNVSVLEGLSENNIELYKQYNLKGVINTVEQLALWKANPDIKSWIHIDTGMNRLGIAFDKVDDVLSDIDTPYGYLTHLASSEDFDNPFNQTQVDRFEQAVAKLPEAKTSLFDSNGVANKVFNTKHQARIGIGLYGLLYTDLDLKPVLELSASVTKIDTIGKGATIGYNSTYVAEKDTTIAAVNIGYADGFNVNMSNRGFLYHGGNRIPVVGRVSMDTIMIDISNHNNFKVGDRINIFSSCNLVDDTDIIDLLEMASICNVSPHNSVTNCRGRVVKKYV
ncbi:MAG: alanine racemase [Alphaproteobacteria bacterium]